MNVDGERDVLGIWLGPTGGDGAKQWMTKLVENFSIKSYDLTLPHGERVQVKCRVVSDRPTPGQLQTSPFRSWDFEFAALVLLRSADYSVFRAALVPVDVVKGTSRFVAHVNGSIAQMRTTLLEDPRAKDITADLIAAATRLD